MGVAVEDDRGMALGAYGRRQLGRSLGWSVVYMAVAVPVLWPLFDVYWLPLGYLVGIVAGVQSGRRLPTGGSHGWRGVLAGLASSASPAPVGLLMAVWMGCALAGAVILTLYGFAAEELAAGAFERAWAETVLAAFSWENSGFVLGVSYFLVWAGLLGLIDGVWIGRVAVGTGFPVWKVLPGGRVWREGLRRDRRRRREYLLGGLER